MSLYSDTLSLFRPNQCLLLLFNFKLIREFEEVNVNSIVFGLTQPGFKTTLYHTKGKHPYHYTTDAVYEYV